jgi:putative ABC transport system ATP-binding protein
VTDGEPRGAGDDVLLELSGIEVEVEAPAYTRILWPCDLQLKRASSTAVVGPSGAGKSTLAAVIGGLLAPTAGSYFFDGRPVHDLSPSKLARFRREHIGFVFQAANLIEERSVWRNVAVGLPAALGSRGGLRDRCVEVLGQVGMADLADRDAAVLSGGERQRVAIARALIKQPKLLIADEPTGALDQANGDRVLGLLTQIPRNGAALLLVTHDPRATERAADVVEVVDGRVRVGC